MQLHECLLLAVRHPTVEVPESMLNPISDFPEDALIGHAEEGYLPLFTNASPSEHGTRSPSEKYTQGSVLSMLQCILHEWGTNSRTNFYIPPEHYPGYSYLCDECPQQGWRWRRSYPTTHDGNIRRPYSAHIICNTRSNCHGHQPSAFVHAEHLSNNYPHHNHDNSLYYNMMERANATTVTHNMLHNTIANTSTQNLPIGMTSSLANNDSFQRVGLGYYPSKTLPTATNAPMSANNHNIHSSAQMTVPYIHPSLELPVPPLHLPLYFGLLCWSFALAGVLMLRLPQKWMLHGRSGRCPHRRHDNSRQVESSRHWFPYRAFAWVLILWQVRCSTSCILPYGMHISLDLSDYTHCVTKIAPNQFRKYSVRCRVHVPSLRIMST